MLGAMTTAAVLGDGSSLPKPVVTWVTPGAGATYPAYSNVPLQITVSDPNPGATISSVTFYQSTPSAAKIIQVLTAPPFICTMSSVPPGTYSVGALVRDSFGAAAAVLAPTFTVTASLWGTGGSGGGSTPPPPTTYTLTVSNGSGGGNYTAGTVVHITANPPPAGQVFQQWIGGPVAGFQSSATTVTMPAANLALTATFFTPAPVPYPVDSHPRLWVTTNHLARLRSWATPGNPVYQQGIVPLLQKAVNDYTHQFFPGGVANPNYPDPGDTQGYQGLLSEEYAFILAFNSLIDPDPVARSRYAGYARNLIMYAMNQAALGHLANAPFRDPMYAIYNHGNGSSECWPLAVDWIYNATDTNGVPVLSGSDKLTIRNVFMLWANDCLNAYTTGGDHPAPIGVVNSTQLLPGGNAYRMAANNYYAGHARLLTLMGLAIDPSDDPAVNPSQPAALIGNSMRSYLTDATGAWLYQQFAMFGDPATVTSAYGLQPGTKVGLASGGLPPEGMLYGHSFAYVLGGLLGLQTAGFHDPTLAGPQIGLIDAAVWGRFAEGFISSLVPAAQVYPNWSWMGPVFEMDSYGDLLRLWITPDYMEPYALLSLLEQENGQTTHREVARWFVTEAVEGGHNNLLNRVSNPWSYGVTESALYFLLLDPALPAAADPRPGYSTVFQDDHQGRIIDRTAWTPMANQFDFRASWNSINHQDADAGQFEFYRKGEWLTKEASNYDSAGNGQASMWHNTLSLKNWCTAGTPQLNWFENPLFQSGSQWTLGLASGDPVTLTSGGTGYTYAHADLTPLYNRPSIWSPTNACLDITHASRSIAWIKPDHVVIYDRASSVHPGLFKQFNLNMVSPPQITPGLVTETTPKGQHLFVQTLLPANATTTYLPTSSTLPTVAWLEPSVGRIVVEDTSHPASVRFLHVLQGADPLTPVTPATLLQSTGGTPMQGTAVAGCAVLFVMDVTQPFGGTVYSVPGGVLNHFITGCVSGAFYSVSAVANGPGLTVTVSPASSGSQADAAGVLALNF